MKRKLAIVLTAALAVSSLAACGGKADETSKAGTEAESITTGADAGMAGASAGGNLTVAWWGNQTRNERTQAALDKYSELNPGITFDGQFSEWSDYWNKLATAAAGHSLPDLIQMDYSYLDQYVTNNLLVDLSPYIEDGTINLGDVSEGIVDSGKVDDKVYAISIGVNAPALVYNKTVTDQAGVTIKDNMTLDEFVAVSKEIYEKTGYKTNMAYGVSQEILQAMIRGYDGHVLFDEGKLGVDSADEFVPFYKVYEDGVKEGWYIEPGVFAELTPGSVEQDPLVYGSSPETMSWTAFCWSNQYNAFANAAPDGMELALTTWPSKDPQKSNFLKPAQLFSVSVDSKNPKEAAKLIDYWTNSLDCNKILLGERGVPISSKVASDLAPSLGDSEQKVISFINDVVTPNSSPINPPYPDGSSEVSDLINKLGEKVCYGELTAEEAAEQLYTEGDKIMADKAK